MESWESAEAAERLEREVERVEGLDGTGSDMSRIVNMSDAVFAFSMTFLVITLVLPGQAGYSHGDLAGYLLGVWPAVVAYIISFFIIANWWGAHRRLFSPIVRYDLVLVRLNNLFLLEIAVTPFLVGILFYFGPSATLGRGSLSSELAVVLYACVQVAGGLLLLGVWRYATHGHRLVEERLSAEWIRRTEQAQVAVVLIFSVSIPVAFLVPFVAMLLWVLVIVTSRTIILRGPRRRSGQPPPPPES
jgi:uncharacterized membrane protein